MNANTRPLLSGELITAPRVREITGISQKDLDYLRRIGAIKTRGKNEKNWALYGEDAVFEILDRKKKAQGTAFVAPLPIEDPNYTTEEALKVFSMIREGVPFQNIIIDVQLHPRTFRAILREYELLSKVVFVDGEILKAMNALSLDGNFPLTSAEMIFDVMQDAARDKLCACGDPRSERCAGCIKKRVIRKLTRIKSPLVEPDGKRVRRKVENIISSNESAPSIISRPP